MEKSQGDVGFLFFSLVVVARVYEKNVRIEYTMNNKFQANVGYIKNKMIKTQSQYNLNRQIANANEKVLTFSQPDMTWASQELANAEDELAILKYKGKNVISKRVVNIHTRANAALKDLRNLEKLEIKYTQLKKTIENKRKNVEVKLKNSKKEYEQLMIEEKNHVL